MPSYKEMANCDPLTCRPSRGFFSIFKRGNQHCSEKHLRRYLAEFDFRYSNRIKLGVDDTMRAGRALEGIKGKRLKYRPADEARSSAF